MHPKISIIVPIHNSEKYLRECLDSILAQDFDDFEILLINDHSVDKSEDICKEYQDKFKKIRFLNSHKRGVSAARNAGINNAMGEWISFVDSDDLVSKDYLSSMIRFTNKKTDLVIGRILSFRNNVLDANNDGFKGKKENIFDTLEKKKRLVQSIFIDNTKIIKFPHMSCSYGRIFRKSKIRELFDEKLNKYEDAIFNLDYIFNCNRVNVIDNISYFYRLNDYSSVRKFRKTIFQDYRLAEEAIFNKEQKYCLGYEKYYKYFRIKNANTILEAAIRETSNRELVREYLKENGKEIKKCPLATLAILPKKRLLLVLCMWLHLYNIIIKTYEAKKTN